MSKRTLSVSLLTAGLAAGVLATTVSPAAAQGNTVGGSGNVYYLSGALNASGQAQEVTVFGDPGDEVYYGDWHNSGKDQPMVRRGNLFFVPSKDNPFVTGAVFAYGNPGDQVLIGDWDGDGDDSITLRRDNGNRYYVKYDMAKTGVADTEFYYGNHGDTVLVGNWDGAGLNLNAPKDPAAPTASEDTDYVDTGEIKPNDTDTLIVQRGNRFFVKNDVKSGTADYDFYFGDSGDEILVGDWATAARKDDKSTDKDEAAPAASGDHSDQLAVRRGYMYHQSTELEAAHQAKTNPKTGLVFAYGNPDDTVFVASLPSPELDADGKPVYAQLSIAVDVSLKISTNGKDDGLVAFDKDGIPILDGYVKDDGSTTDPDDVADERPVHAINSADGVIVTAYNAKGESVLVAPGSRFSTDGSETGGYLFDKDGLPYIADDPFNATTPLFDPADKAEVQAMFLAGNDTDAATTGGTLVFDKAGNKVFTTQPARMITGDGLGVRRVVN